MTEARQAPDADDYQGQIDPASMVVPPQDKPQLESETKEIGGSGDPRDISTLGSDTPQYGTETPYRKTPPTNMGSVAEAAATSTPPTGAAVAQSDADDQLTPVNTVLPTITGTVAVGQVITCGNGTWSPAATSYGFQWYYYPDTVISGATAAARTLVAGDQGKKLFCRVTGKTTAGGSSPVDTAPTITVP